MDAQWPWYTRLYWCERCVLAVILIAGVHDEASWRARLMEHVSMKNEIPIDARIVIRGIVDGNVIEATVE